MHKMKYITPVAAALVFVVVLHLSGLLSSYNLTHTIWRTNATMFGSLMGAGLAVMMLYLISIRPALAKKLVILIAAVFACCLVITLHYANIFINAAEFDRFAIQIWHKGSYTLFVTFVPLVAYLLSRIFGKNSNLK